MKDRDRRKLHAVLILLAAVAVAVMTALPIIFAALAALFVFGRKGFLKWLEERKAENDINKEKEKSDSGLMKNIIKKIFKIKKEKSENEVTSNVQVKPIEFDKISKDEQSFDKNTDFKNKENNFNKTKNENSQFSNQSKDFTPHKYTSDNSDVKESDYEDNYVPPFSTQTRSRFNGIQF